LLEEAAIESDERDRLAVPIGADPPAVEPVASSVAAPVGAVLAPTVDVGEVDADVADVPAKFGVVLLPVTIVEFVPGDTVVVLLEAGVSCVFVDVVCARSAAVPSRVSASVTVTAADNRRVTPRRMP
jgi:hypothetical protein